MAKGKLDVIIQVVKATLKKDDKYASLIVYLNDIKRGTAQNPFGSSEILSELVRSILSADTDKMPMEIIADAESIYRTVVPLGKETQDYGMAKAIFLKLFEKDGIYYSNLFSHNMYLLFYDKPRYVETMCALSDILWAGTKIKYIENYAVNVRQYFAEEKRFSSAVISAAIKICHAEDSNAEVEKLLKLAERAAGIYDISEESISRAEMALHRAEEILEGARHTFDLTEQRLDSFKGFAESNEKALKTTALDEIEKLRREAKNAELELKRAYDAFLNEEHEGIIFEKDKLVREVVDSADGKIREMRLIAENIKDSTAAELFRINTEANRAIDRASAMLNTDEIKNIISELQKSDELVERIIRVDKFSRSFEPQQIESSAEPAAVTVVPAAASVQRAPVQVRSMQYNEPVDMTANLYLNDDYPFKQRFDELMAKKQQDISENGALYHERFDDIITAVIEDSNPYLIGPSGCGKTYLVAQIAELLGLEFIDIGYINEEYDLLGFQTADGGYNYPAFYRAYKYGGIVFCDEFDNGNIRAAVKLNSFMSNGKGSSYCFPNGERVRRHPNFRIIAAGNTTGDGADRNYNTREKIEESLQQRFTAIYVDYDNRLEQKILEKYPQWFEFVVQFRKATDAWSRANEISAPGIFTTRDAASIKKYLDHESYGAEAIMSYEFIETKDSEYLAFLQREMQGFYKSEKRESGELFDIFCSIVSHIRSGGARR